MWGDEGIPFITSEKEKRRRGGDVLKERRDGGRGRVAILIPGGCPDISSRHSSEVHYILFIRDKHAVDEMALGAERRLCWTVQSRAALPRRQHETVNLFIVLV